MIDAVTNLDYSPDIVGDGGGVINLTEPFRDGGALSARDVALETCSGRALLREGHVMVVGSTAVGCRDGSLVLLDSVGRTSEVLEEGVECFASWYRGRDAPLPVVRADGELGLLSPELDMGWTGFELQGLPVGPRAWLGQRENWNGSSLIFKTPQDQVVRLDASSAQGTIIAEEVDHFDHSAGADWVLLVRDSATTLLDLNTSQEIEVPSPSYLGGSGPEFWPRLSDRFVVWAIDGWVHGEPPGTLEVWTPALGDRTGAVPVSVHQFATAGDALAVVSQDLGRVHLFGPTLDLEQWLEPLGTVEVNGVSQPPQLLAHRNQIFYGGTRIPLDGSAVGPYRMIGDRSLWLDDRILSLTEDALQEVPLELGEPRILATGLGGNNQPGGMPIAVSVSEDFVIHTARTDDVWEYWLRPLEPLN